MFDGYTLAIRGWSRCKWAMAFFAWVTSWAMGFGVLLRYDHAPGDARRLPPLQWPAATRLAPGPRATLLLFAHPRCACTRASIGELARLLPRLGRGVRALVLVLEPSGVAEGWDDTEVVRGAARIPGVTVVHDSDGSEAARFNAATSGLTLLYDAHGALLFHGGITPSRGHEGDSFGARRLLALVRGQAPDRHDSPVFGCALQGPAPVAAAAAQRP